MALRLRAARSSTRSRGADLPCDSCGRRSGQRRLSRETRWKCARGPFIAGYDLAPVDDIVEGVSGHDRPRSCRRTDRDELDKLHCPRSSRGRACGYIRRFRARGVSCPSCRRCGSEQDPIHRHHRTVLAHTIAVVEERASGRAGTSVNRAAALFTTSERPRTREYVNGIRRHVIQHHEMVGAV